MDRHIEELNKYEKTRYSKILCSVCGEKKIPIGQETLCEINGKYFCPECISDIEAERIRDEREK